MSILTTRGGGTHQVFRDRSRGQVSTELLVVAGLLVAIVIALGITFRSSLTTAARALGTKISCAVSAEAGCSSATAAATAALASSPQSARTGPYGLVSVPLGGTAPGTAADPKSAVTGAAGTSTDPTRFATTLGQLAAGVAATDVGRQPVAAGAMGVSGGFDMFYPPAGAGDGVGGQTSRITDPYAAVKIQVNREIADYLGQFRGTKFGQVAKIGNPDVYAEAARTKLGAIITGAEGKKLCDARPKGGANGYHNNGPLTADLVFPFDPAAPVDPAKPWIKNRQRQTMMHEMTHHIEWTQGVKYGPDVFGNPDPRAERNTAYQDQVVNRLNQWVRFEQGIEATPPKWNTEEAAVAWRALQADLAALNGGSAAGGVRPGDLQTLNGFRVVFDDIRNYYLSDACKCPKLAEMVRLAETPQ